MNEKEIFDACVRDISKAMVMADEEYADMMHAAKHFAGLMQNYSAQKYGPKNIWMLRLSLFVAYALLSAQGLRYAKSCSEQLTGVDPAIQDVARVQMFSRVLCQYLNNILVDSADVLVEESH